VHGEVVQGQDPREAAILLDGQATDAVGGHELPGLRDAHPRRPADDGRAGDVADPPRGVAADGEHTHRQIAVGHEADGPPVLLEHHRADLPRAHELGHLEDRGVAAGGHHPGRHDVTDPHTG